MLVVNTGMAAWRWQEISGGWRPIHVDPTQHGVVTVEAEHHEIHEGHMWHWSGYDLDLDNTELYELVFTTPSAAAYANGGYGPYVHLSGSIYVSAQCIISFIEGITELVGGSAQTLMNRNRNCTATCQTAVKLNPTSYGTGSSTTLETQLLGTTGNVNQRVGGEARTNIEWVLAPATSYVISVNPAGDDTIVSVNIDFYEHYHKDNWDEETL
jgi:hypothetical protein